MLFAITFGTSVSGSPTIIRGAFGEAPEFTNARQTLALLPEGETDRDVQNRTVYQVARAPILRAEGRFAEALGAGLGADLDERLAIERIWSDRRNHDAGLRAHCEAVRVLGSFPLAT